MLFRSRMEEDKKKTERAEEDAKRLKEKTVEIAKGRKRKRAEESSSRGEAAEGQRQRVSDETKNRYIAAGQWLKEHRARLNAEMKSLLYEERRSRMQAVARKTMREVSPERLKRLCLVPRISCIIFMALWCRVCFASLRRQGDFLLVLQISAA